jgi:integrase
LRRSEVLGVQWKDLDLDKDLLHVRRGLQRIDGGRLRLIPTKTVRPRRAIPLPPMAARHLRRHREIQAAERVLLGSSGPTWVRVHDPDRDAGRPQ